MPGAKITKGLKPTIFERASVVYFLFTFEFEPLSTVFTTFFLCVCMGKDLQVSQASFSLIPEPRHEGTLLQLQNSGQSMPTARHLASCIQPGQFVEDEAKRYYLKLNCNIASH